MINRFSGAASRAFVPDLHCCLKSNLTIIQARCKMICNFVYSALYSHVLLFWAYLFVLNLRGIR